MAELKITANITQAQAQLKILDKSIDDLKKKGSEIKLEIKGADTLQKLTDALHKYSDAEVKAAQALADSKKAQVDLINARTKEHNALTALERKKQDQINTEKRIQLEQQKSVTASQNRAAKEATAQARIQSELLKTERQAKKTGEAWKNMFSQFSLANIVSSGVTRAISTMRSAFREALQEMKALDLAATHYQQVMGESTTPAATKALTGRAYSVGSKYGTSASDYMESVATYARAGYKEAADALAELSMKTVIVGQTTQEVADQFLLTMDTAYKYGGAVSELSKVLDGASAIDSEYATTIEKIATGLGLVAPLAQQVHVSEAELTAAIGTITAATQRSGAEAARALRSLFLNIIKDTTTEIEDGVTATEESVASVQYLLEKYAKSAMDAARATGEVVNPMEAIAALAQSMKDGLLTEQQLMELLSGIGGKLRISQLVALISNWDDMYVKMLGTYENAIGSADKKTAQYLDSWEAKINILKNTWTEFVAKTISSDFVKGIIDAGTKVLKVIGDLGNGIRMLAGIIATVKFAKAAADASSFARTLQSAANTAAASGDVISGVALKTKAEMTAARSAALGWASVAVAAITTVITAYDMYHNKRMQQFKEERDQQTQEAQVQKESYDKINEAYGAYLEAKQALDDNKISSEEYETAVYNLATALGVQNEALAKNVNYLETVRQKQAELTKQELEDALQIAKITANEELKKIDIVGLLFGEGDVNVWRMMNKEMTKGTPYEHMPLLAELIDARRWETAVPVYQELLTLQERFLRESKAGGEDAELYAEAWSVINQVLTEYADVLDPIPDLEKAVADASMTMAERTQAAAQSAREAAEAELIGANKIRNLLLNTPQWDKYFYKPTDNVNDWERHYSLYSQMDEAKSLEGLIATYKKLTSIAADYNKKAQEGGENASKYAAAYDELISILSLYAPTLEDAIAAIAKANGAEYFNSFEAAVNGTTESVSEAAKTFHGLADAIQSASDALAEYEKRTEGEKDDNYKKYAEAWEKAFEDIQAGKRNSNAVNAALDLFFTPKQIMDMKERGIDAADELMSEFYREIFTYMDGENLQFTGGEDSGSLLAYYLWDKEDIGELQEDGKKIISYMGMPAATLEEVNGELTTTVFDVNMLSEALREMGINADPDFLTVWLEGLSMYSEGFEYTAKNVREFAEQVGALDKNFKVDLEGLISGRLDLGETTTEVANLLDAVIKMGEAGQIQFTVSGEELETAIQNAKDLIVNYEDLDEKEAAPTVDADTEDADTKLDETTEKLTGIEKTWVARVEVNSAGLSVLDAYQQKLYSIANAVQVSPVNKRLSGYASGTKNAGGGLALVNEEAPELILENGHARIAGSGMPTLTYLASGATVYTAKETKNILGGSYPTPLFDGINAYAGGLSFGLYGGGGYNITGINRWTPPSSGKEDKTPSTDSSSGSSYSVSSGSTGSSAGAGSSSSSSSSKDKDPQLEALENRIKLLKSELALMEELGQSLDLQIDKQREIQKAIQDQIIYLGTIGGDQEEINKLWTEYWKIENEVYDLRIEKAKGELDVLEASNATVREQIEKQREIATIYKEKLDVLQQTGGSQIEINKLLKEELAIQESIAKLNKELMNGLADAINHEIDALEEERDGYIKSIQDEIDALNKERDAQEEVNREEELNLELMKAREALMNAQNERTVRMYNAATGQWEWVADAQAIKSAQDSLASAEKAMADYLDESAFNAKIDALTAEQERYTELYAEKTDKWQEILKSLEDPIQTIAEALEAIENNATRDMQGQINDLNKLLAPLGYSISTERLYDSGGILSGIGGIKATMRDEAILPPDVTARLLRPIQPAMFEQRMNELRYLYGASGTNFGGSMGGSIGSQHNGDLYTFGNVTLTTEQAQNTTIYDFVQAAKGLRAYSGRM